MTSLLIESGSTVRPDDWQTWLETRRTGIGASESAALLSVCPYTTPRDLYLRKIGLAPEVEETEGMRRGRHMEAFLASEYRRTFKQNDLREQVFLRHSEHPFLFATLDGLRADGTVVEFKTAGPRLAANWGAEGTDDVPTNDRVQVQHQMAVTNAQVAHVYASVAGDDARLYLVQRNDAIIDAIIAKAIEFWAMVETRTPPPVSAPSDGRTNHLIYPEPAGAIDLDASTVALVDEWEECNRISNEAKGEGRHLTTRLLEAIGPFEQGRLPDGRTLRRTVVPVKASVAERKAYTYTKLTIKKARCQDAQ